MLDSWSPGLLLALGTGSEAHAERRSWRRVGGRGRESIIRVGGCVDCLSWQQGTQAPLWEKIGAGLQGHWARGQGHSPPDPSC